MVAPNDSQEPGNYLALALIALAIMLDGYDIQIMGYVMPALLADWQVAKLVLAPVLTAGLVGMIIGSAVAGTLGDIVGRKTMLSACLAILGASTLACGFASNPTELAIGRLATGIGMGGAIPNAIALVFGLSPARYRLFFVAAATIFVPVGGVVGGLIAARYLPTHGWRAMFFLGGGAPLLLSAIIALFLPAEGGKKTATKSTTTSAILVDRQLLMTTASLCVAFFSCLFGLYSLLNWLPALFDQSGFGTAKASLALMIVNVGGIVAALGVGWIAGRVGSRLPLVFMFASGGIASAILWFGSEAIGQNSILLMCLLLVVGVATAGAQSILLVFAAEAYEERIRATGVGWAVGFGRLGGIASAFVGALILSMTNGIGAFFMVESAALFLAMIALMTVRGSGSTRING